MTRFRSLRLGVLVIGLALLWNRGDAQTATPAATSRSSRCETATATSTSCSASGSTT